MNHTVRKISFVSIPVTFVLFFISTIYTGRSLTSLILFILFTISNIVNLYSKEHAERIKSV